VKKPKVILISAVARNRVIGVQNDLPWSISEDMQFFVESTRGHSIVMGRETFESVGSRPLPKRQNIVISSKLEGTEQFDVARTIDEVYELVQNETLFVCGGSGVYSAFLQDADELWLTEIDQDFEGDTFFPVFDQSQYVRTVYREISNPNLECAIQIVKYVRRRTGA
jgi:dihydrofolate reductase